MAWPVFYPLPAILLVLPFSLFPVDVARVAFSVLAGGVLGFAMGSRWRVVWPLFLSEAYFLAISRNQWSPFMLAAIWLPAFGFFAAAKPNIGIIAAQTRETIAAATSPPDWRSVLSGPALMVGECFSHVGTQQGNRTAAARRVLLLGALVLYDGRGRTYHIGGPDAERVRWLLFACAAREGRHWSGRSHARATVSVLFMDLPDFNAYYDALARLTVGLALIPVLLFALANHGFFRKQTSVPAADADTATARTPALGWIDGALLFLLLFAFLLQLWLLSGL
jgi:hypothetical protein